MERYIGRGAPHAYAALRIVSGLFFATHGAQKLFGVMGGHVPPFASQSWFAGVIELVTGLLVALGLFTSWAAFVASGEMAVAYFQVHARQGFWPVVNRGELSAVYSFLFLYFATRGTVAWGLRR
jgi:putative oxidoreductase